MRRIQSISVLILCLGINARAQVFIINENIYQGRMSDIKTTVLDSLTNEPVGYASVYVIPSKDTTITNFTLTDAKGEAKLEEVPYGSYVFHVEMMGYKPYINERYFREQDVDMGTIRLQVDEQFIQAATITDVGNPIVVKKDTVEFNASSYRVGSNAMLKDLLQRMPGMEITESGKVKFNGEEIDKLTVGGRTFFFNDQSTALNNLPAAVVDKIRVIDRESKETRATGIQDGSREKVLDVALKTEYEKGWFGNVGVKGGTTLGKKAGDDVLRDNRGLLYSGNALVSAYSEKDQLTFIANGQNINESNAVVVFMDDDGQLANSRGQGLSTAAQLGLNANTSRIKDVETTVSVNYKYTDTDSGSRARRTTFQDDGNLSSSTDDNGKAYNTSLYAHVEMEKEKGKVWFYVLPSFRYTKSDSFSNSSTEASREETFLNSSVNSTQRHSTSREAGFYAHMTLRELGGKKKRSLRLVFDSSLNGSTGGSTESSVLTTSSGVDSRAMTYDSKGSQSNLTGGLTYTEPLGEKWLLSASASFYWYGNNNVRDAFDKAGRNDYYSSVSQSQNLEQRYGLTAQYSFGEKSSLSLGGTFNGILTETYSKSYGIEDVTGKGVWNWFFIPSIRFQYNEGMHRISLRTSGNSHYPSPSQMHPVLNISNPSRLSLGNVYLKSSSTIFVSADWTLNNREKFRTLMVDLYGQIYTNPTSSAQWYDSAGILYSIPVNSPKPTWDLTFMADYTLPIDARKNWSLSLNLIVPVTISTSFQSQTARPGLDKESFDYSAFMADFWGNASGDRFFGGASGFKESQTFHFNPGFKFDIKYNQDHYSFMFGARTQGSIARYTLDPKANMTTLETRLRASGSYTTKHEFEFETDLAYIFYNGYEPGYGLPEWRWNASVSKNIGAFNLSITVHDILNQTRNLTHTVTANYEEDSYRLIMGRYILFGVKWNFGKMNAAHSARAQRAAWNMVF